MKTILVLGKLKLTSSFNLTRVNKKLMHDIEESSLHITINIKKFSYELLSICFLYICI